MGTLPTQARYICTQCIARLHYRPIARRTTPVVGQWREYADSAPAMTQSAPIDKPGATSEQPASFRLAKHFNRDPGLARARNMRAPNSALKVDLDNGNHVNYSRHRNPTSAPRTRSVRKVSSISSSSKPTPEPENEPEPSKPSNFLAQKPQTHAKVPLVDVQDCNWYWETLPPTIAQKAQATHFFLNGAAPKFLRSAALFRAFPDSNVPEVAFIGRSNVGKSSLLNAVVNADTKDLLAKTSSTPGFTKTMNLYGLGPGNGVSIVKTADGYDKIVGPGGITIVDMPGYGEGSLSEWGVEIMKYLQGRKQLRRVFVLVDAQHGIKDRDRSILASLRLGGISHQVILSKIDKLYIPKSTSIKRADGKKLSSLKAKGTLDVLQQTMKEIRGEIQPPAGGGALGEILSCSSEVLVDKKRLGIDAVRFAVCQAAGMDFGASADKTRKKSRLVRTMNTNNTSVRVLPLNWGVE